MAEDLGERTELPSGRRLSEARGRGQVAKSQDLASAIELTGAVLLIVYFGGAGLTMMAGLMRRILQNQTPGDPLNPASVDGTLMWAGFQAAKFAGPALGIILLISVLSNVIQVGWLITTEPLMPKLDRLNPVAGIKRLFNTRNLMKTILNSAKLAVVVAIGTLIIRRDLSSIAALPALSLVAAMYKIGLLAGELVTWLLVLFVILGLSDYIYQRWQYTRDLRMTKQEAKDERRSVDGDPDVKSRRLRMARDISMQRVRHAVPKADVIVTNPTHFSIALKYDPDKMRAPKVIAKGADEMAFVIREIAVANRVPIVERPPLARGLYWGVDVGREIAPQFYEAVAEVLAYVYRIRGKAA